MLGRSFPRNDGAPVRVLALGAHSDDLEIGCGGFFLRLLDEHPNCVIRWVVFSGAGTPREAEARVGFSGLLGAAREPDVRVLAFRDGFFPAEQARIKEYFEAELKPFEPDLVLTHYREDRHQDHRVLSDLAWNTFRRPFILEYEVLKYDGDLGRPNVYVPLPEAVAARKVAVLMEAFGSQRGRHWFDEETFRALLRVRGVECAAPYAEAFYGRKLVW